MNVSVVSDRSIFSSLTSANEMVRYKESDLEVSIVMCRVNHGQKSALTITIEDASSDRSEGLHKEHRISKIFVPLGPFYRCRGDSSSKCRHFL